MHFNAEFFDGECSVSQNCILTCDENSKFSIRCNDQHIDLEKIGWKKTATKLFLTSESLKKHAYIAVEASNDQREILKLLTNIKKNKLRLAVAFFFYILWDSWGFCVLMAVYGFICIFVAKQY